MDDQEKIMLNFHGPCFLAMEFPTVRNILQVRDIAVARYFHSLIFNPAIAVCCTHNLRDKHSKCLYLSLALCGNHGLIFLNLNLVCVSIYAMYHLSATCNLTTHNLSLIYVYVDAIFMKLNYTLCIHIGILSLCGHGQISDNLK